MKYVNYLVLFVAFIFSISVFAQQEEAAEILPLPLDVLEEYEYTGDGLSFHFQAEEQGVLAIAFEMTDVESRRDTVEVAINISDQYNQEVGDINEDYNGRMSAEQGIFVIPSAGQYTVRVQIMDMSRMVDFAGFLSEDQGINSPEELSELLAQPEGRMMRITSTFAPTSSFASFGDSVEDVDGDRIPANAGVLSLGTKEIATVGGASDPWDWWKMECSFVQIVASTDEVDIVLETYDLEEGEWRTQDTLMRESEREIEKMEILQLNGEPIAVRIRPFYAEQETQYDIEIERCLN